ncbi:triphosphoribosyl-dephospho-CoA synthase CitG [Azotosporobacter soli]|uniref:triphosphoribosyl-dephospho-CoA synthase CitG n=1 Tax=Azotosporobacter soli TaxID=3055040 RepID=UPI0031FE7F2F
MKQVSLEDMLAARDRRLQRQSELRREHALPLAAVTLNIPGAVKDGLLFRRLCDYAVNRLAAQMPVREVRRYNEVTGPEGYLLFDWPAEEVKAHAMALEEENSFGRLLDIDVWTEGGEALSRDGRAGKRSCFICGGNQVVCRREGKHSATELLAAVDERLAAFAAWEASSIGPEAEGIGALALEAMLYEAASTPAPGLVDRVNSGAHEDMDFYTFMASSAAIGTAIARCAQAGLNHSGELPRLLPVLRQIGKAGEKAMFSATGGINTQKGVLFLLGLLAAATGYLKQRQSEIKAEELFKTLSAIVAGIVERELEALAEKAGEDLTAGERLYLKHGITGVRGEAARGLPAVAQEGLPTLRRALAAGMPLNDALIQALLALMTCVEDTTVINRHQPEMMRGWVCQQAKQVLAAGGMGTAHGRELVRQLDELFIARRVSPGGAADLLAATWFVHRVSISEEE